MQSYLPYQLSLHCLDYQWNELFISVVDTELRIHVIATNYWANICKISEILVNNSELKNIENEEDKNKAIEEETLKRTKWIIESFMENDQRVDNIITDISRDDLGLI